MSHISRSEDMASLKDQADSSSFEETNSLQRSGGGKTTLKKGPWTSTEDAILVEYVTNYGDGNWGVVQKHSGLSRCGKSCRLRWTNHLRPNLKKGAFTSEEERLIAELHLKFGNKWSRMAADLPGRTDNEIKNYWNTRVKRRQRAGLPLYPPGLCSQTSNENLQVQATGEFNNHEPQIQGTKEINDDIPDAVFDHFKGKQGLLFLPSTLPDISSFSNMLTQGPGLSQKYGFRLATPPAKRLRPETFLPNFSFGVNELAQSSHLQNGTFQKMNCSSALSFPYAPDPKTKNLVQYGAMPATHAPLSSNLYASNLPSGSSKLARSSFQYQYPGLGNLNMASMQPTLLDKIDAFFQNPYPVQTPSESVISNLSPPRNNGLLDAILYESQILNSKKNQSSKKRSASCVGTPDNIVDSSVEALSEHGWEEDGVPIFPLGHIDAPVYTERVHVSGVASSQEQQALKALTGSYVEPEMIEQVATSNGSKESSEKNKNGALLDMDWFDIGEYLKDQSNVLYDVSKFLGIDI